jgi:hypothetical protein
MLLLPGTVHAQIPEMQQLCKEAGKVKDVNHVSVGSFLLGMASKFTGKEQRAVFKMLDNIELVDCSNSGYAPQLAERAVAVATAAGAVHLADHDDVKAMNSLYAVHDGEVIEELVIIVYERDGCLAVVAMSGRIPLDRLREISKIKP